jgi:hypothetical protein
MDFPIKVIGSGFEGAGSAFSFVCVHGFSCGRGFSFDVDLLLKDIFSFSVLDSTPVHFFGSRQFSIWFLCLSQCSLDSTSKSIVCISKIIAFLMK